MCQLPFVIPNYNSKYSSILPSKSIVSYQEEHSYDVARGELQA